MPIAQLSLVLETFILCITEDIIHIWVPWFYGSIPQIIPMILGNHVTMEPEIYSDLSTRPGF